jgi:hypothetical protein
MRDLAWNQHKWRDAEKGPLGLFDVKFGEATLELGRKRFPQGFPI